MLGLDNMIKDMLRDQLGIDPEQLKVQLENSFKEAHETVMGIRNSQAILYHQNLRIIKLLEHIVGAEAVKNIDFRSVGGEVAETKAISHTLKDN